MVNIGFIKMGNLGMSQVINLIQDEIAAREGITIRVFGTGAKMSPAEATATESFKQWNADFVVIISPNAAAPGPTAAREIWKDKPCIIVSDGPTKKEAREAFKEYWEKAMDWWDENGKVRERIAELIDRVGFDTFLKAMDIEPVPQMVKTPRANPYIFWRDEDPPGLDDFKKYI